MSSHAPAGRRTVIVMAVVAVVCLAGGFLLSSLIVSPGKAAADAAPPAAGPISVPVERREIGNTVTLRGDVGYDDPAAVRVETSDLGGPAVVTGHVPAVGDTLEAGAVALEITGRPVILLPGDLPTYRSLRAGVSGPDVAQLKTALRALGIEGGDPANDEYDAAAAAGVRALYQRVGYDAPTAGAEALAAVDAARDGVTAAQRGVTGAQSSLKQAQAGQWTKADKVAADGEVATTKAVWQETEACAAADPVQCPPSSVIQARSAYDSAVARRALMDAAPDTSAQRAELAAAQQTLTDARNALADALAQTITPLPASEVVYLPSLPRRVDMVAVQRGSTVSGEVMTVSGATIQVVAAASRADAELLAVGSTGTIDLDGTDVEVTVASVTDPATAAASAAPGEGSPDTAGDRWRVVLSLPPLDQEQIWQIQGRNVRIRIPVSSTQGEVLVVPLAALTAGPGGESRVEVVAADGTSRLVTVTTGLAAEGYVEITSSAEPLEEGDLVAVGIAAEETAPAGGDEPAGPDPTATP